MGSEVDKFYQCSHWIGFTHIERFYWQKYKSCQIQDKNQWLFPHEVQPKQHFYGDQIVFFVNLKTFTIFNNASLSYLSYIQKLSNISLSSNNDIFGHCCACNKIEKNGRINSTKCFIADTMVFFSTVCTITISDTNYDENLLPLAHLDITFTIL